MNDFIVCENCGNHDKPLPRMNFFWNWDLDNKFDHYNNPKSNFRDTQKKVTVKEYDVNGKLIKETITEG